jgi:ribosome biogenesis GTPase A
MKRALVSTPFHKDPPFLAASLGKAADTVSNIGPEFVRYGRMLNELSLRFSEGRFHLAVLGQFKRGKSTLLNALIGESILPVGVVPLTAAPTFIQFGETAKIRVRYQDSRPEGEFYGTSTDARSAYLAGFVTERGNPQNRQGIAEVQVDLPAPILSDGLVLIDTPGIGSTCRHNTTVTLDFLKQCDAALFMISADPPITEVELEFLRQVKEMVPRLFFVLNKIDYLDEGELEEALFFYKRVLAQEAGCDGEFPVFCVSARKGLESKAVANPNGWAESGMAQLESFLVDFLAGEKLNALMDAVSRRALDLIDAVLMEAGIVLQALKLPLQELEVKITLFDKSLQQAENERRLIHDVLEGDKKRVAAFVEELSHDLGRKAEQFLKDIMNGGAVSGTYGKSAKTDIQQAWVEAIPDFFEQQRTAPLPMLQSLGQRLDGLVRRNVENIRWSMLQNLNVSFAGFARKVRERLDETVSATKGAMDSAHARIEDHGGSIESELIRLGDRIGILEELKTDFAAMRSDTPVL